MTISLPGELDACRSSVVIVEGPANLAILEEATSGLGGNAQGEITADCGGTLKALTS